MIFSEIGRTRSAGGINGAVRDIANNVIERFPLEGTIVAQEDDRYRINIGKNWRIGRGTEFTLTTRTFGEGGKVPGYPEIGRKEGHPPEHPTPPPAPPPLKPAAHPP